MTNKFTLYLSRRNRLDMASIVIAVLGFALHSHTVVVAPLSVSAFWHVSACCLFTNNRNFSRWWQCLDKNRLFMMSMCYLPRRTTPSNSPIYNTMYWMRALKIANQLFHLRFYRPPQITQLKLTSVCSSAKIGTHCSKSKRTQEISKTFSVFNAHTQYATHMYRRRFRSGNKRC